MTDSGSYTFEKPANMDTLNEQFNKTAEKQPDFIEYARKVAFDISTKSPEIRVEIVKEIYLTVKDSIQKDLEESAKNCEYLKEQLKKMNS